MSKHGEDWNDVKEWEEDDTWKEREWKLIGKPKDKSSYVKKETNYHHHSYKSAEERRFYNNHITIEFKDGKKSITVKGKKSRYGLLIGQNGKKLKNLKSMYRNCTIEIPSRDQNTNEIYIRGPTALDAALHVVGVIAP